MLTAIVRPYAPQISVHPQKLFTIEIVTSRGVRTEKTKPSCRAPSTNARSSAQVQIKTQSDITLNHYSYQQSAPYALRLCASSLYQQTQAT